MHEKPLAVGVAFGLLVAAHTAVAQSAERHFAMMGLGAGSCSDFAKMARLGPENADTDYLTWAQGFMSGINFRLLMEDSHAITKNLSGRTIEYQKWALKKYCDEHPLGEVESAIMELYISLPDNPPSR